MGARLGTAGQTAAREVDGAVGAAFLATLKGHLENPVSMLL